MSEPVREENFWTSWCKERLTDTAISNLQPLRLGEEKIERRRKKKPQGKNIMACPIA